MTNPEHIPQKAGSVKPAHAKPADAEAVGATAHDAGTHDAATVAQVKMRVEMLGAFLSHSSDYVERIARDPLGVLGPTDLDFEIPSFVPSVAGLKFSEMLALQPLETRIAALKVIQKLDTPDHSGADRFAVSTPPSQWS